MKERKKAHLLLSDGTTLKRIGNIADYFLLDNKLIDRIWQETDLPMQAVIIKASKELNKEENYLEK